MFRTASVTAVAAALALAGAGTAAAAGRRSCASSGRREGTRGAQAALGRARREAAHPDRGGPPGPARPAAEGQALAPAAHRHGAHGADRRPGAEPGARMFGNEAAYAVKRDRILGAIQTFNATMVPQFGGRYVPPRCQAANGGLLPGCTDGVTNGAYCGNANTLGWSMTWTSNAFASRGHEVGHADRHEYGHASQRFRDRGGWMQYTVLKKKKKKKKKKTPGTEIGGYRIEGLLGRGGMGIVYEATQHSLGPQGGAQAARRRARSTTSLPRPLPARGPPPGRPGPRAHRPDLRGRRTRGRAVHRDAARARRDAQGAGPHAASSTPDARARDPAAGRRRARHRARGRPRPPRHQAAEHPRRPARPRLSRRLRPHARARRHGVHARGSSSARSTTSRPSRSAVSGPGRAERPLLVRGRRLRVPERAGAVPRPTEAAVLFAHIADPPPRASGVRPELPAAVDDGAGARAGEVAGGAPRDRPASSSTRCSRRCAGAGARAGAAAAWPAADRDADAPRPRRTRLADASPDRRRLEPGEAGAGDAPPARRGRRLAGSHGPEVVVSRSGRRPRPLDPAAPAPPSDDAAGGAPLPESAPPDATEVRRAAGRAPGQLPSRSRSPSPLSRARSRSPSPSRRSSRRPARRAPRRVHCARVRPPRRRCRSCSPAASRSADGQRGGGGSGAARPARPRRRRAGLTALRGRALWGVARGCRRRCPGSSSAARPSSAAERRRRRRVWRASTGRGPGLLPRRCSDRAGRPPEPPAAGQLGEVKGYRYEDLQLRGRGRPAHAGPRRPAPGIAAVACLGGEAARPLRGDAGRLLACGMAGSPLRLGPGRPTHGLGKRRRPSSTTVGRQRRRGRSPARTPATPGRRGPRARRGLRAGGGGARRGRAEPARARRAGRLERRTRGAPHPTALRGSAARAGEQSRRTSAGGPAVERADARQSALSARSRRSATGWAEPWSCGWSSRCRGFRRATSRPRSSPAAGVERLVDELADALDLPPGARAHSRRTGAPLEGGRPGRRGGAAATATASCWHAATAASAVIRAPAPARRRGRPRRRRRPAAWARGWARAPARTWWGAGRARTSCSATASLSRRHLQRRRGGGGVTVTDARLEQRDVRGGRPARGARAVGAGDAVEVGRSLLAFAARTPTRPRRAATAPAARHASTARRGSPARPAGALEVPAPPAAPGTRRCRSARR